MRIDFQTHDILVQVAGDKRKGIWASSVFAKNSKPIRTAGSLPTSASLHTLQLIALATSLRGISKGQHTRLGQNVPRGVYKPRLMAVTMDATFAEALKGLLQRDVTAKPLRAGKNFLNIARQQLARFDVTIQTVDDPSELVLLNWARKNIVDPKLIAGIPPSLAASVVSAVV